MMIVFFFTEIKKPGQDAFGNTNDDGTLVLSKELGADVLQRWHIPANLKVASFRTEQLPYLDFHRECVFKG